MKHTNKLVRLLSTLVILTLLVTLTVMLGIHAFAEDETTTDDGINTEAEFLAAVAAGGEVELAGNITLTQTATVTISVDTTISSPAGTTYTIYRSATTGFSMFTVSGVTVTLKNVILEGNNTADSTAEGGAFKLNDNSNLVMDSGATIQHFKAKYGGAVCGSKSNLILLTGSKITENEASGRGSAIKNGKTWLVGGEVSNNYCSGGWFGNWGAGGAIFGQDGSHSIYMYGGKITGNWCNPNANYPNYGSAISLRGTAGFYMEGGEISGNISADKSNGQINATTTENYTYNAAIFVHSPTSANRIVIGTGSITETKPAAVKAVVEAEGYQADPIKIYDNKSTRGGSKDQAIYAGLDIGCYADDSTYQSTFLKINSLPEGSRLDMLKVTSGETSYYGIYAALSALGTNPTETLTVEQFATSGENPKPISGTYYLPKGTYTLSGVSATAIVRTIKDVPMFRLLSEATVTFKNIVLDGQDLTSTGKGGGIYIPDNAVAVIQDGTVIKNFKSEVGAGILVDGSLEMTGGVIGCENHSATEHTCDGNSATDEGGGIYLNQPGYMELSGGKISGNTAADGGGVHFHTDGYHGEGKDLFVISGTEISGNSATKGGGLSGWAQNTAYEIVISGGKIFGNTATEVGGGVYIPKLSSVVLSNTACIAGNIAGTNGGGVYMESGAGLTMNGGNIGYSEVIEGETVTYGNSAVLGGGIYVGANNTFTMNGGEIAYNTVTKNGGGIYGAGTSDLIITKGKISNNKAESSGGGIFKDTNSSWNTGKNHVLTLGSETANLDETTAADSAFNVVIEENEAKGGAGIYAGQNCAVLTIYDDVWIKDNTSTGEGGGLWARTQTNIHGGKFSGNTGTSGGGLHFYQTTTVMDDGYVYGNTSTSYGGGIVVRTDGYGGSMTISNVTIESNQAQSSGGGGICLYSKPRNYPMAADYYVTLTADNVVIKDNWVAAKGNAYDGGNYVGMGGGIFIRRGGVAQLNNVTISGNKAGQGGGIGTIIEEAWTSHTLDGSDSATSLKFFMDGYITIDGNSQITGNYAGTNGGGIFVDGATKETNQVAKDADGKNQASQVEVDFSFVVALVDGAVTGNQATAGGAAIYAKGDVYLLGGEITGNTYSDSANNWAAVATVGDVASLVLGKTATVTYLNNTAGTELTSEKPLKIYDNGANNYNISDHATLVSDLVAGSKVVFGDNYNDSDEATEDYFLNLGYASPSADTLDAICLHGADKAYKAEVSGSTLVWPTDAYQYITSYAVLDQEITFSVCIAARNSGLVVKWNDGAISGKHEARVDGTGTWYDIPMSPKHLTKAVNIGGTETNLSLKAYLDAITSGDYTDAQKNLAQAVLYYGYTSQVVFDGASVDKSLYETPLNDAYTDDALKTALSGYSIALNNSTTENAPVFSSAQVFIDSTIKLQITVQNLTSDHVVKMGNDVVVSGKSGTVTFEVALTAGQLADTLSFAIQDSNGDVSTLGYGVYTFMARKFTADTTKNTLFKAVYHYAEMVTAYK